MITATDLQQLFAKMSKAGWNMEQPLAWGYFFKDERRQPLQILAQQLEQQGYEVVAINQSFPDQLYWLQLEKIEEHTVDSLHQRNQQFYQLAEQMQIKAYDGMDVSPVEI